MSVNKESIMKAQKALKSIIRKTPLEKSEFLSKKFKANIYLKREDLQNVRSYKIRGAYNHIVNISKKERENGIICASSGNHGQGVAKACRDLKIKNKIFMPISTPRQKINRVCYFGDKFTETVLTGNTYDECYEIALRFAKTEKLPFIHPFDNEYIISGQGTIGLEILKDLEKNVSKS